MAKLIYNPEEMATVTPPMDPFPPEEDYEIQGPEQPPEVLTMSEYVPPFDWSRLIMFSTLGGIAGYALCEIYGNVQDAREEKLASAEKRKAVPYARPRIPCTAVGAGAGVFAALMVTVSERQAAMMNAIMMLDEEQE